MVLAMVRWEAGPVEHRSAEAKSLKTKGQRTVQLPPQWATIEAARRGAKGLNKIKRTTLMINLLKETSNGQAMSKESSGFTRKKKDAYSMLQS